MASRYCCCTASRAGRSCTGRCCRYWPGRGCAPSRWTWPGSAGRTSRPRSRTTATPGMWSGSGPSRSTSSDLRGVTLVGQDWGGLIGLRLVAEHPGRFARVVAANTGLPTGDQPMPDVWLRFREVVRTAPRAERVPAGAVRLPAHAADEVLAAYDAPFPDESFMAGPRAMPGLVPTTPDDPAPRGQPGGLAAAGRLGQAVPGGVQRPRPDHRGDGAGVPGHRARRQRASSTRSSPGPVTSSRRTRVSGSAAAITSFIRAHPAAGDAGR